MVREIIVKQALNLILYPNIPLTSVFVLSSAQSTAPTNLLESENLILYFHHHLAWIIIFYNESLIHLNKVITFCNRNFKNCFLRV